MPTTRFLTVSIALLLSCATAQACKTASPAHVQLVLKESIRLNETFKSAAVGTNESEYRRLRKLTEQYEEFTAIPCLRRTTSLLQSKKNWVLMTTLFEHALSHENSADETESEVLAQVFVNHYKAFMVAWDGSSTDMKRTAASRVKSGWPLIRPKYAQAKWQQIESRIKQIEAVF